MGASSGEQRGAVVSDPVTPVGAVSGPSSVGAVVRVVVRRGEYHDPVTLMEASEAARSVAGVAHVAVGMAEPLNLRIWGCGMGMRWRPTGWGPMTW